MVGQPYMFYQEMSPELIIFNEGNYIYCAPIK